MLLVKHRSMSEPVATHLPGRAVNHAVRRIIGTQNNYDILLFSAKIRELKKQANFIHRHEVG